MRKAVVIMLAAALLGELLAARFTSEATTASLTITTADGDITLSGGTATVAASVPGLANGDHVDRTVSVKNASTWKFKKVTFSVSEQKAPEDPASPLMTDTTDGLQLSIDACDQAWDDTDPDHPTCAGTISVVAAEDAVLDNAQAARNDVGPHDPDESVHLRLRVRLPDSAPNELQGQSVVLVYHFVVTQAVAGGPPAPSGVTASRDDWDETTQVTWDSVEDATYYRVTRTPDGGGTPAVDDFTASPSDPLDAYPGVAYRYTVAACDNDGCGTASTPSSPVTVTDPWSTLGVFAGTGTNGYGGDGGEATLADIKAIGGLTVGPDGALYVSVSGGHRIRKVYRSDTAEKWYITTVAGTGTAGYGSEGQPATATKINGPRGLAFDSAGNLIFADTGNHRVRKIDASDSKIYTVAGTGTAGFSGDGGAATSAKVSGPYGVAVDSSDNIYILDTGNDRVRKVDASTGDISTVAGGGSSLGDGGPATSAQLNAPRGIAVDSAGNIYIGDYAHYRVRKVDASTGYINTVAGTGAAGSDGDGGPATSAKVYGPAGVAMGSNGVWYLAEVTGKKVRRVAADGTISTAVTQSNYVDAVALGPKGLLFSSLRTPAGRVYAIRQ